MGIDTSTLAAGLHGLISPIDEMRREEWPAACSGNLPEVMLKHI